MNSEIKHEQSELIPDKDGFLFQIIDDNYIIGRFWGVTAVSFGLLCLLSFYDFNPFLLANSGYKGHTLIFLGLPWLMIESIRIYIYMYKGNFKTIKFYETYIENGNKKKILVKDLIDIYLLKFNFLQNKVRRITPLIFLFFPIAIYIFFFVFMSIFIYSLLKKQITIYTDNLLLVSYDNRAVGIPLKIIDQKDKLKVEWYIKKYIHKDIYQLKRKLVVPEDRSWNLVNEERKQQILKDNFNKD